MFPLHEAKFTSNQDPSPGRRTKPKDSVGAFDIAPPGIQW
jgi:hypothetical protein